MKRKLEIIRSLMHRPGVLFLDEPTSGLDPVSRRGLWDYLREVRDADGTTIFLTTHYLEEAEEADRVCVIDHGRIAVIGTPDELKRQLLDRSIVLDAADRPALAGGAAGARASTRSRTPDGPPAGRLRRRDRPGLIAAHPHAAVGAARARAQPRGGVRGAPPAARGGRRMSGELTSSRRSATAARRARARPGQPRRDAWRARPTPPSRSPGARSCGPSRARCRWPSPSSSRSCSSASWAAASARTWATRCRSPTCRSCSSG